MNELSNKRWVRHILLISLIVSSLAAVIASLEGAFLPQLASNIIYLIYLPSVMLLFIAFHSQYRNRDVMGMLTVSLLFMLVLLNMIFGSVI